MQLPTRIREWHPNRKLLLKSHGIDIPDVPTPRVGIVEAMGEEIISMLEMLQGTSFGTTRGINERVPCSLRSNTNQDTEVKSFEKNWNHHTMLITRMLQHNNVVNFATPDELNSVYFIFTDAEDMYQTHKCVKGSNFVPFNYETKSVATGGFALTKAQYLLMNSRPSVHLRMVRIDLEHPELMMIADRKSNIWYANAIIFTQRYYLYTYDGYKYFESNCPDTNAYIPNYLALAIKHGSRRLIDYLLDKANEYRDEDYNDSTFHMAATAAISMNDGETLKTLHKLNFVFKDIDTYISQCCLEGHFDALIALERYYLTDHIKFYTCRPTLLQVASKKNHLKIVEHWVTAYPIFRQRKVMIASLWAAVMNGAFDVALFLVSKGDVFTDDHMTVKFDNRKRSPNAAQIRNWIKELGTMVNLDKKELTKGIVCFPMADVKGLEMESLKKISTIITQIQFDIGG